MTSRALTLLLLLPSSLFLAHCGAGLLTGDDGSTGPSWTGIRQLGSAGDDTIERNFAVSATGEVFVTGTTDGALDGIAAAGAPGYFLVHYDALGNKVKTILHGVAGSNVTAYGVAATPSGGAAVVGQTDAATLDGQIRTGTRDLFISLYDSASALQGTKLLGGDADSSLTDVVTDGSSALYAVGSTDSTTLGGAAKTGGTDAVLVKYDLSGNRQWIKLLGVAVNKSTTADAVAISPDKDAIFVAGTTSGALNGVMTGTYEAFVAKYDTSGNQLWVRQFGGEATTTAHGAGVAVDSSGRVYLCGFTTGSLPGNTRAGNFDAFISQFDSSGNRQWITQYGASGKVTSGSHCGVNAADQVYQTGQTKGALDGGTAPVRYAAFLARFDSSGTRLWTRLLSGGTQGDVDSSKVGFAGSNTIFIAGQTYAGLGGNTLTGTRDLFVAPYDSSGNLK